MRSVGEILKAARLEKNITLEEVGKSTKIRTKYLQNIERNEWEELPGVAYTKGFIRAYAESVGLVPAKIMAIFRREFIDQEKRNVLPQSFVDLPGKRRSVWLTIVEFITKLFQ